MSRALGLFGFTSGFLMISPSLRQTLVDVGGGTYGFIQQYAPYSYAGVALVAFGAVTLILVSGSSPRA